MPVQRPVSSPALALALLLVAAGACQAATATAYSEQSKMIGSGRVVTLYRLPTTDANGNLQYFDVQITMPVSAAGVPGTSAKMVATVSPTFVGNSFVGGTYQTTNYGTMTCTQGVSTLSDGRESGGLNCSGGTGYSGGYITFGWATGPIAGHPYQTTLLAAHVDQIGGYQDFGWGTVGSNSYTSMFGCMNHGDVISATQSGNVVTITDYGLGNVAKCGAAFTLLH